MSKYNAVITEVAGIRFASRKEANRWSELQLMERAGEIKDLQRQVKFSLDVNGVHIANYYCDFQYFDYRFSKVITEDTKGVRTPVFRIKVKLMKACHGIDILET